MPLLCFYCSPVILTARPHPCSIPLMRFSHDRCISGASQRFFQKVFLLRGQDGLGPGRARKGDVSGSGRLHLPMGGFNWTLRTMRPVRRLAGISEGAARTLHQQTTPRQLPQHPTKDHLMGRFVQQPPRLRDGHMVRHRLVQAVAQETDAGSGCQPHARRSPARSRSLRRTQSTSAGNTRWGPAVAGWSAPMLHRIQGTRCRE